MKEVLLNEPLKMSTPQEKAPCVAWFIQIKSDTHGNSCVNSCITQEIYGDRDSVRQREEWETKNSNENIDRVRQSFLRSPSKSIRTAALELELPCSPDITPLDFFLWGYVKDIVYRAQIRDITDLKQRIVNAIATIDEAMLQRTWLEIDYRLDVLRATNGAHIEVY